MPEEQREPLTPEVLEKIRVRQERVRQEYAMRERDVHATWFGSILHRHGIPIRFFPQQWCISVKPFKDYDEKLKSDKPTR